MSKQITGIVTWLKNWFYDSTDIDGFITTLQGNIDTKVNISQGSSATNKNVVTNSSGNITTEDKITVGSGLAFDGNVANKINHSNSVTAQTSAVLKKIKYDAQGHITGVADVTASDLTDTSAHSNIGTSANATQATINTAIDTKLGEMVDINFITVVQSLPTASASTMGKIYLVAITGSGTNNYAEYVTVRSGSSGSYTYEWEKFGEISGSGLSVDWADITSKPSTFTPSSHTHTESEITDLDIPSNTSDLVNDGSDGSSTYVETDELSTVAQTGDYTDLLNIPSDFTPSSHTHGNISDDGKIGTSANKIITTGTGGVLQASSSIPVARVIDSNAHVNIGTSANTLQSAINTGIDTVIGGLKTDKQDEITSIVLIPKTDDASGKIVFYTGDEPT